MLSFDDWYDKYGEQAIADYEDEHHPLTDDELSFVINDLYEAYCSDYEDYAYELYRDRLLFEED